jgi:predicted phage terminase large subunit-like protein
MYDYAEFMGWYLSEGSAIDTDSTSPFISIRQTKPCPSLTALMERLPWRVKDDGDGGYRIFSRQLVSVLKPMGSLYEKRVPRLFFKQSPDVISRLLDAFVLGDGSFHSENGNDGGISIGLANEGLIDDLQELYTLVGRVAVKSGPVRINKDDKVFTHWRLSVSKKDRQITQLKASGFRMDYTGKVWCLSVPGTHNFLVRHKGRCHFTGNSQYQFEYMMSRNRSTCGIRPLIRATTNPDSDSWVASFISWWIDQETGFPIPERSGKVRYMIRLNGERIWGDSPEELAARYDCDPSEAKSVTFVSAKITDNPILLKKDPGYLSNLKALSKVERARLLDGNWRIRPAAGMYFPREDHKIIDWLPQPSEMIKWVRSWDLAASEESEGRDPDFTVGLLVGRKQNGKVVIGDMIRVRRKAAEVRSLVRTMAVKDGRDVWIVLARDPGQAGKEQAESYLQLLNGFTVVSRNITRSKTVMAEPAAALWQQGNIEVVRADWNEDLLSEFEQFPEGRHDDIVDCVASAVISLPGHSRPDYSNSGLSGRFKTIKQERRR